MSEAFEISAEFKVDQQKLFNAWLDSKQHAAFTSYPATCSDQVGGSFIAGDNYIFGKNLELIPHQRIVQSWRTTDFPEDSPDSVLEIVFDPTEDGTKLTLKHSNIPTGQGDNYRQGWEEYYFKPMRNYFTNG